jgi:5-methylcytosine-specific restriction endonuclease McrA
MKTIKRNCLNCHAEFFARPTDVRRGHGKYCSISCSTSHINRSRKSIPEPNVECAHCDKPFYLNRSKQKNSKSGLFFCCREHKDLSQRIGGIEAIQPNHYGSGYRALALAMLPQKCNRCAYEQHPEILQVHHRDHDHHNNDLENLEILCPNCHVIEHKYPHLI